MSLKRFLTSRTFFINLLLAVVLVIILLFVTMSRLKSYTHHGDFYTVPLFSGMTLEQAEELAHDHKMKVQVIDSIYSKFNDPGTVVEQVPAPGKHVKEGRLIYLTMNALEPEKVQLPRLTDISFRQAAR